MHLKGGKREYIFTLKIFLNSMLKAHSEYKYSKRGLKICIHTMLQLCLTILLVSNSWGSWVWLNKHKLNSHIFSLTLLKQRRNLLIREYLLFQDGRIPLHFAAATSPQLYSSLKTKTTEPTLLDNFKNNPEVSCNHI